jgi:hypothetical protein
MENTTENKSRFFALYINQKVLNDGQGEYLYPLTGSLLHDMVNTDYLSLRSIASLTESELITCFDLIFPNTGYTNEVKTDLVKVWCRLINKESGGFLPQNYVTFIDYLRSIGILIPFMGLSVDEIINRGWAKY